MVEPTKKTLDHIKVIGGIFILILVINIVLFVIKKITTFVFWFVIILAALVAYILLPRLKK